MTLTGIIIWVVLGAISGWLAGQILKGGGFGFLGNVIVGIVGSFFGGWLGGLLGIGGASVGGLSIASIITAVVGAIVLLAIIGFIKKS